MAIRVATKPLKRVGFCDHRAGVVHAGAQQPELIPKQETMESFMRARVGFTIRPVGVPLRGFGARRPQVKVRNMQKIERRQENPQLQRRDGVEATGTVERCTGFLPRLYLERVSGCYLRTGAREPGGEPALQLG
ncbi:MAG TPA: hypothetical protein VF981_17005 [Gemmatimonadaceae bacterium]